VGNGPSGNPFDFLVFIGNDAHSAEGQNRANFLDAASVHFHPSYVPNPSLSSPFWYDVGAIVTVQALPPAPLPVNRKALDQSAKGMAIRVLGFGITVDSASGVSGKRYELDTTIKGLVNDHITFQSPGTGTCHADSGGPTLATLDGTEVVIGVHSAGASATGTCTGATDYEERIDLYLDFLDPIIEAADPGFLPGLDAGAPGLDAATAGPDAAEAGPDAATVAEPADAGSAAPAHQGGCSTAGGASAPWLLLAAIAVRRRRG
jgi:hypothetical protein